MLYVLIVIIITIIFSVYNLKNYKKFYFDDCLFKGLILGCVASLMVFIIYLSVTILGIGKQDFTETYQLGEIVENQYYQVNAEGNSVSVFAETGKNIKEKMTFSEDVVKFKSDADEANIQIKGREYKIDFEKEMFWFVSSFASQTTEYEEVIISVPEESEITKQPSSNKTEKKEESTGKQASYCTECGAKLQDGNKFCGECGLQLE